MDTPQTLEKKYRLQKWHIVLLVILGLFCVMILKGIYNDVRREHIRKDFLQTVADIYTDAPGTLQPNYIADGWCYFLVEEEHAVYRIAEGAETPEPGDFQRLRLYHRDRRRRAVPSPHKSLYV